MDEPSFARPIAPIARESMHIGVAQLAVGLGGLVAAMLTIDGPPRALVLFAVSAGLIALSGSLRARWITRDEAPAAAPAAAPGARRESAADTARRALVISVPAVVLVGVVLWLVGGGLGAILAGVVAGSGMGELRAGSLARARGDAQGAEIWRELGNHPFAGPRRAIYTLPRNASTLDT